MQTNTINLADRVAVVTGGAQGIGLEVGRRLLESGARLVIWDVNPAGIEQARTQLSQHDVHFECVDIADFASVRAAVAGTMKVLDLFSSRK